MNAKYKKILMVVIPLIIAVLSIFVVSKYATSAKFHEKTIESLDEKRNTALALTATSTAASAAITLIPGDVATPIADKLADLSSYFLVVICAIYLEKYLLTITGYAAFVLLIPIACLLFASNVFWERDIISILAKKMFIFAIAIVLVVPVSVKVADLIEATYDSSIEETIDSAQETTKEITDSAKQDEEGWFAGIISKVKDGVSGVIKKVETILNNLIEALAVMIVTSCVIPILVLMFFVWLIKIFIGIDLSLPNPKKMSTVMKKHRSV
ncbi:hypothetical protein [Hespellia stercorisuis]|uniref:Beta-carotene 15,15'-monooxygenase n=1 Tax=Hespellia stercorisuis DSM 15480 TaxID=1121950 RepID=A0A1M6VY97_9FIRM|nr:hypothetical protein [Hespellia stercorisuis]SHK86424.1 hypothetical protein SAMN02745243_03889 [Hespellia stercorisuis DSM 15480]